MIERTLVVMKQSAVKFTVIEKNTVTKSVLIKLIFSFELYVNGRYKRQVQTNMFEPMQNNSVQ